MNMNFDRRTLKVESFFRSCLSLLVPVFERVNWNRRLAFEGYSKEVVLLRIKQSGKMCFRCFQRGFDFITKYREVPHLTAGAGFAFAVEV